MRNKSIYNFKLLYVLIKNQIENIILLREAVSQTIRSANQVKHVTKNERKRNKLRSHSRIQNIDIQSVFKYFLKFDKSPVLVLHYLQYFKRRATLFNISIILNSNKYNFQQPLVRARSNINVRTTKFTSEHSL